MKCRLLIAPIILGLLLAACGEEKDTAREPVADTIIPLAALAPPDTAAVPLEVFENVIYREYAQLAVRLPKQKNDSLLKAVIRSTKDPKQVKDKLQKAMAPMRSRQDSIARHTLAAKYRISVDSVNAIIEVMKGKTEPESAK